MKPSKSVAAFRKFADLGRIFPRALTPKAGIEAMLQFYRDVRFDSLVGENGDMLLYQWGVYDWGRGPHFEIDLTRQFIEAPDEEENDPLISQMHFTFYFPPGDEAKALESKDLWCTSISDFPTFEKFVRESPPLQVFGHLVTTRPRLDWEYV